MKQLITAIASLLLISLFLIQFVTNQGTHSDILYVEKQVDTFAEQLSQDGYITIENKTNLQNQIAAKVGCPASSVIITGNDTSPVIRGTMLEYSVTYPVKGVIGSNELWGISDQDNVATKIIKGKVTSEYITWD